jgi:glyoxylase-like metal-dependent hydrolase (beta-lactamase superfamily II)
VSKKKNLVLAVAIAMSGWVVQAGLAFAQTAPAQSDMVDRFYRGRAVVNAAAQAAGGAQALRGITAISYVAVGDVSNDIQGYRAKNIGNPETDGAQRVVSKFDFAGSRFHQLIQQSFKSGMDSEFATIWRGGTQYALRYVSHEYTEQANAPSPFGPGGPVMVASRWVPPIVLSRALQNFRSISWAGEGAVAGEAADIVEMSFDEATRFRVYVTKSDRKVRRVEAVAPDPVSADDVSVAEFSGDQTVSGVVFPARIVASRRGAPTLKLALRNVEVNPKFADTDFAPPAEFKLVKEDAQVKTTQVAGRVYEVSGLAGGTYQVPFVVMDDFVVAYEAPLGVGPTRQVMGEIKKVAGDKPIKYVVISHFHNDHSGGVGAYADAGVTVLSSEENRQVLLQYAQARSQFQGQEGRRPDVTVKFEAVPEGGFEIVDKAGGKLRVIDFAGNSHVEHMLALHDPQSRVVMGADHYIPAVLWNPTFEKFASWLRDEDNAVDMVTGVHHRPISRADLLQKASSRKGETKRRVKWPK